MTGRTVLVVEDEIVIADAISARLRAEGYTVHRATDGHTAVRLAGELDPDLIVLDWMLPGLDGLEVCRRVQQHSPVPVLMLTARDAETDVVIGLGVGADDYLTKPFSPRELVARVQALLRRSERAREQAIDVIRVADVTVDIQRRRVTRCGTEVHLTPLEFDLLVRLTRRPDIVITREQLLVDVWGYRDPSGARVVDSHVKALRRKLGEDVVRTIHGVGYAGGGARTP